jgi:hypothetical protein
MVATLAKPAKSNPQKSAVSGPVAPVNVMPMAGELQPQFFDRAMRALKASIPSVNRRTIAVLNMWKNSPNDQDLRIAASSQFPQEKYQCFGPRCVFIEHTMPGVGELPETNYNRKALEQLVAFANHRIRDRAMFSAISAGHTPTQSEVANGREFPSVLGYGGPFYLGLLGDVEPKWAIYCDEYIHVADVPQYERLQRRSPEVWCNEPMERRTLDPIAALGAETPRLDSGMNPYSRASDGMIVRYSAMAFPSGANVYVPNSGTKKNNYGGKTMNMPMSRQPQRFGAQDPMSGMGGMQDPMQQQQQQSPDIESAILNAIQGLLPSIMQAVKEEMGEGQEGQEEMDPQDFAGASDEGDGYPRGMEPQDQQQDQQQQDQQQTAVQPQPNNTNQSEMDDDEKRQYSAMSPDCQRAYSAGRQKGMSKMNYSRGGSLHDVLARCQVQIKQLNKKLEQRDQDAVRYSRLNELSRHYDFSVDEEMETVLDLSDKAFEHHCTKTITKYSRRDDLTSLQFFDDPTLTGAQVERYGRGANSSGSETAAIARYSRQAEDLAAQKNGKKPGTTTFEAEFESICRANGITV